MANIVAHHPRRIAMLRLACCSALTLFALLASLPAASPPPPATPPTTLEAGGCTFWQCSITGATTPSMFVCLAECGGGTCTPVNVCAQ
jgi:hypothetical protein